MLRRTILEQGDNQDRWLVSYADFITLLFGFFVVMYAISSVNEGKYRVLSHSLTAAFDFDTRSLDPIQLGEPLLSVSPHVIDVPDTTGYQDPDAGDTFLTPGAEQLAERLAGLAGAEQLQISQNDDWLEISLDSQLLFAAGEVELAPAAQSLVVQTASYLSNFDTPITVEGYTDNVPSSSARFPSNWELSAARAAAVVRSLVASGVDRKRLTAVGYGENHALQTNATPAGRAANRRVVVVVARRGNLARNLNSGAGSALALVRQADAPKLGDGVQQVRTERGSMLFTNDQ